MARYLSSPKFSVNFLQDKENITEKIRASSSSSSSFWANLG